ncbi:hypothetical protein BKA63DRAFT_529794 [Paraphoma chrysanthemicola]|nr:hypothetical protein BKA63DRAFT_529794 [Paraphoma chrysanthemicola]
MTNNAIRHIYNRNYCLKVNKVTKQEECRFWLPDELRDQAKLGKHPASGRDWLWFFLMRNDGMINKYNRLVTMAWQANTDISPCTDPRAVIEYVVKYATKAEKKSLSYRDLAGTLIPFVNERRLFQSLVTKLMNKLIDLLLKESSRAFHSYLYRIDRDETRRGLSLLEKYKARERNDEHVNYITFLKPRDRILSYFPRYSLEDTENYGRAKLMLHYPFREIEDLLYLPDIHNHRYNTFTEAYAEYGLTDLDFDQEVDDEDIEAEWTELARQLPNRDNNVNIDLRDNLGLHLNKDCSSTTSVVQYDNLEEKQKVAHQLFVDHCQSEGGTSKTTVVRSIYKGLDRHAQNAGKPSPVLRAAPTRVAAHNISTSLTALQANIQIKANNDDFGGINILLIGDFCQLPPVAAAPLFSTKQRLYKLFNTTITLNVVKRQQVHAYNHQRLRDLNNPVLPLRASHRGHEAENRTTKEAGNLHKQLYVSINSRIMLGENIWADHALFNGAVRTLRDVDAPLALLVAFDGYDGPELLRDPETNAKLVPIFRLSRDWLIGNVLCGISLDRAILNLSGKQDFAAGLTYVAISRVRSLGGLLFEELFGYARLKAKASDTVIMRNADYARRKPFEYKAPGVVIEDDHFGSDLPTLPPSTAGPGRASQMEIPILRSDPVQPSGFTIPSGFVTSGNVMSDGGDVVMSEGQGSYD